jgi:hypothetical protein
MAYGDKSFVVYTLKDEDTEYPSLYKLYLAMEDPTEIVFAKTYLDGWEHWQMLCETIWFKPYVKRWRIELDLLLRAKALANILSISRDPDSKYFYESNKFLLSNNWKPDTSNKVGRPSKEAIKQEAEALFNSSKETQNDYLRLIDGKPN